MFVVGNTLAVYGGIAEVKDKEITYDDCWTLDLNARDKWAHKLQGTMHQQVWLGDEEEDDDEFDNDDEFDQDDRASSENDESGTDSDTEEEDDVKEVKPAVKKGKMSLKEKMDKIRTDHDLTETYTPLVGESLKDFYARTQAHWSEHILKENTTVDINDRKEIRRLGFVQAGARFEATASILAKLKEYEEEQTALETPVIRKSKTK